VSAALLSWISLANAQGTLVDGIAAFVGDARENGDFHGSMLVAKNGNVIYEDSAGFANYQWDVRNAVDTKFRIGSMTKSFTAVLIMQQLEKGRLALEDTISDHLSYYRRDSGSQVTIRHLLNHTSGIPNLTPGFAEESERDRYEVQELVELFCSGDLEFAPGQDFSYSNAGYYILGAILEKVTGESYGELLRKNVFEPAGMTDSQYSEDFRIVKRTAYGYRRKDRENGDNTDAALLDPSVPFAAAGIYSTVRDLYKFDRALYSEQLLSEEFKALMYAPLERPNYTNGWISYDLTPPGGEASIRVTMHQGSINGFSGVIYRNRDSEDLVVILNNLSSNGKEWSMGEELIKMLAGS
jgi:CubicO group peptidase (beta-lactamase class C family)